MGGLLPKPLTAKHTSSDRDDVLEYGFASMQGWRHSMEDAETLMVSMPGSPDFAFFGVFDGHGGDKAAMFTSEHLWRAVAGDPAFRASPPDVPQALVCGFLEADCAFYNSADRELLADHSGCTAVVVMVDKRARRVYCANAGDSRAVLCRAGRAIPLSADHKPEHDTERARIEAAGYEVRDGRVDGKLAVSRGIGERGAKGDMGTDADDQAVTAMPDIVADDLTAEDEFFIVACDGIWDCLSNQEAVNFVRDRLEEGMAPVDIAAACLDSICPEKPHVAGVGCDNMTMVVVKLLPAA